MRIKAFTVIVAILGILGWRAEAQIYDTNNVVVQTFVGSGFYGYYDGEGTQTMFYNPSAVVADSQSNLFILDSSNYRIRKVTPDGTVSTFAGGGSGTLPGYGTNVSLYPILSLSSMTIDHSNALLFTDSADGRIILRVGSDGFVSSSDISAVCNSYGVCVDSGNNIYISSFGNKIYRYRTNAFWRYLPDQGIKVQLTAMEFLLRSTSLRL